MSRILITFIWICVLVASDQAQVTAATPVGQRGPGRGASEQAPAPVPAPGGQRSGGRGASIPNTPAAWWTDTALMTRLGLTDQQKLRIESSFQAYRLSLTTAKETLEKEEAQLARLLDADSVERSAVLPQVNKVIQARSEMERLNATMTVEMREQLTRAQWAQLQGQPAGTRGGRGTNSLAVPPAPDSFALRYAADKPVTLDGKVTEFRFQDPHSFIIFDVVGNDGKTVSWTGELGPSTLLTRQGWNGMTLKPGDRIVVEGAHSLDPAVNAVSIRTVRRVP